MLTSIRQSAGSSDWQKDGGKYIPYPSTWLNGRRWEDEGPSEAARASVASEWWLDAGFSSQFEAENMGCHLYNRTAFKDGSPIQEITA